MPDTNLAKPMQTRRAAPASVDVEARTARAIASTYADVPRSAPNPAGGYGDWIERLDPAGMDASRFTGAPLLLDHSNRTDALAGIVESAQRGPKGLEVTIRFAKSARGDEALGLVSDGILSGTSIGYSAVYRLEPGTEPPVFVAIKWTPLELSLTPLPADSGARIRSADIPSTAQQDTITMDQTIPPADAGEIAMRAERTRVTEIEKIITNARNILGDTVDDVRVRAVSEGTAPDMVRQELLERAIAKGNAFRAPILTPVSQMGHSWDAPESIRARAVEALASRATGAPLSEPAREFAGIGFVDLARRMLEAGGVRLATNAAPATIIARAITTSDFPLALLATQTRILQDRLAVSPGAARTICRMRETPDFRAGTFLQFAGIKELHLLQEGGEIQHSPPAERGEGYQAQTFARGIQFTRQALVNDDLGALDQTMLMANAVVATEAAEFVKMFATNGAGWGPTLTDGDPLFHANHGNVGSGAVGTAGISAGRIVMRAQTDASGNLIAPEPRILLVGAAGETAAEQALNATSIATTESGRPVFANRMTLAVEPRLSGAPWFMFADPASQPVIAFVTVAGSGGIPIITQHTTSNFDGVAFKLVHDFAVAPMSYVGAVRLTGS